MSLRRFLFYIDEVCRGHEFRERGEGGLWSPIQKLPCLGSVTLQEFNFVRSEVNRVYLNNRPSGLTVDSFFIETLPLPLNDHSQMLPHLLHPFPNRMGLSCGNQKIIRLLVLENLPDSFHIILRVAPVAIG